MATARGVTASLREEAKPQDGIGDAWVDLQIPPQELRLDASLEIGQCFHWKQVGAAEWLAVIDGVPVIAKQDRGASLVRSLPNYSVSEQTLRDYFNVGDGFAPRVQDLRRVWATAAPEFAQASEVTRGLRVLKQDPVEALFSFICSSNNNVARITLILDRLRARFGEPLGPVPGSMRAMGSAAAGAAATRGKAAAACAHVVEFNERRMLHRFPTIAQLAATEQDELREIGLGYRARFVKGAAEALAANVRGEPASSGALDELARMSRQDAEAELRALPGVGPKVAACVALFGLGHADAVPVDVHVARAAARGLAVPPNLAQRLRSVRAVSPRLHEEVGDAFRNCFGAHAGWAQTLIFAAERLGGVQRGSQRATCSQGPPSRRAFGSVAPFVRGMRIPVRCARPR